MKLEVLAKTGLIIAGLSFSKHPNLSIKKLKNEKV